MCRGRFPGDPWPAGVAHGQQRPRAKLVGTEHAQPTAVAADASRSDQELLEARVVPGVGPLNDPPHASAWSGSPSC